jgi:hypothetical protein
MQLADVDAPVVGKYSPTAHTAQMPEVPVRALYAPAAQPKQLVDAGAPVVAR